MHGDFFRTRLTHSLEVSSSCKQLGSMIADNLKQNRKYTLFDNDADYYASTISTILSCAGLLHDIGNPPFGHFGESSISSWFKKHLEDDNFRYHGKPVSDVLSSRMEADLCSFDGNAQTLRILFKQSS